jgi:hypothetical protein
MQRFYDRLLGDYSWPRVLVPYRGTAGPRGPVTMAGTIAISRQLLREAGVEPGHCRWPGVDDLIMEELLRGWTP